MASKDFPVIDISRIDDPEAQLTIAKQITDASSIWGFLLLKNHPIPPEDVNEMFSISRDFFALPPDQKNPWPIDDSYMGYNAPLSDRKKDDKASMWLAGRSGQLTEFSNALPPYWHKHIHEVETFKHACHGLIIKLLRCFALAMDLPDRDYFACRRCWEWESIPTPVIPFTQYYTVRNDHTDWVPAPCLENHIPVNLGDALAFWSGGRLKATKHTVTFEGVAHDVERLSMAYFGAASPETVLEPLNSGGERMGKYDVNGVVIEPGVTVGEYSRMIMESIYGVGVKQGSGLEASKGQAVEA